MLTLLFSPLLGGTVHAVLTHFPSTTSCLHTVSSISIHPSRGSARSSILSHEMRSFAVLRWSRLLSNCPSCHRSIVRPLSSFSPFPTSRWHFLSSSSSPSFSRSFSSFNASLDEWKRYNSAGLSYLSSGQLDQAEQMFIAALRSSQHLIKQNQQHNSVPLYLALSNLATAQRLQGKTGESKSNAQQALDQVRGMRKEIGAETVGHMYRELGLTCEAREEWEEARQNYVEAEKCYREKIVQLQSSSPQATTASAASPSPSSPSSLPSESATSSPSDLPSLLREHSGCLFALGVMSEKQNDLHAAISHYNAALEQAKRAWGNGTVNVAEVHVAAGKALLERGRRESDEQLSEAGREQLMEALTIYQEKQDKKLLEVLPVYLSSLQAVENLSEMMKEDEEDGRNERKTS